MPTPAGQRKLVVVGDVASLGQTKCPVNDGIVIDQEVIEQRHASEVRAEHTAERLDVAVDADHLVAPSLQFLLRLGRQFGNHQSRDQQALGRATRTPAEHQVAIEASQMGREIADERVEHLPDNWHR